MDLSEAEGKRSQESFVLVLIMVCLVFLFIENYLEPYEARNCFILSRLESAMAWTILGSLMVSAGVNSGDEGMHPPNNGDIELVIRDYVLYVFTLCFHLRFLFLLGISFSGDIRRMMIQLTG